MRRRLTGKHLRVHSDGIFYKSQAQWVFMVSCLLQCVALLRAVPAADGALTVPTPAIICSATNFKTWATVSGCCHLLLYYKLSDTDLPMLDSGSAILEALTDEPTSIRLFGESPFIRTPHGLRYALYKDKYFRAEVGEVHRDQCLATFAQVNLPLQTRIHLRVGIYCVRDLLNESISSFDPQEPEPAWTAIAFAHWIPPQRDWTNRFRERTTFSQLARHLIQVDVNTQSCAGTHLMEALGLIRNADAKYDLLDSITRTSLNEYLNSLMREVIKYQDEDGSWSGEWCSSMRHKVLDERAQLELRVLVTGHLVTILQESDTAGLISSSAYNRAIRWLRQTVSRECPNMRAPEWLCPLTHACLSIKQVSKEP